MVTISPTRPERAEAHSPGQRPGLCWGGNLSPCKGKSFKTPGNIKLLPLQGALLIAFVPRASPWVITAANLSPCKGKSFKTPGNI